MPKTARNSLVLGARIFALVTAGITVWSARGRSISTKEVEILDLGKEGNLPTSTPEPWQSKAANPFSPPGIYRRASLANSIASTGSTTSIMAYIRDLHLNIWPSNERGFHYASYSIKASTSQPTSPGISYSPNAGNLTGNQDQEFDVEVSLDSTHDFEMMDKIIDAIVDGQEISSTSTGDDEIGEDKKDLTTLQPITMNLEPNLYYQSKTLFKSLAPLVATSSEFPTSSRILLEDLGRLHLWGSTFDEGRLDAILGESEILKTTVLDLLYTLSRVLVENVLPILAQDRANPSLGEQVKTVTDLLGLAEQRLFGDAYEQKDVDENAGTEEIDYGIEEAAFIIRSSMDCLMGLLPSMERVLASLESPVIDQTLR